MWKAVSCVQTANLRAADSVRLLSTQIALQIPTTSSTSHLAARPGGQRSASQLVGIQHVAHGHFSRVVRRRTRGVLCVKGSIKPFDDVTDDVT